MAPRKHRRKLYYPIGLISLVILPLLFISYVKKNPNARAQHIMELNLMPLNYREWFKERKKYEDLDTPPEGKWKHFIFTNDEKSNSLVIENLRYELQKYNVRMDTLSGIEIRFNKKTIYNNFVLTIDMLNINEVTRFFIIDSSIWVPRYPRLSIIHGFDPNISLCGCRTYYPIRQSQTWAEGLDNGMISLKYFWKNKITQIPLPVVLIWIGIFVLNIRRVVKWLKPNNINRLNYLKQ